MKLPKSIHVGNHDYEVSEVEDLRRIETDDHGREQIVELLGHADYANLSIRLERNQAPTTKIEVLMHEVAHTVLNEAGLGHHPDNEQYTLQLTTPIMNLIRDNPELCRFLQKELTPHGRRTTTAKSSPVVQHRPSRTSGQRVRTKPDRH